MAADYASPWGETLFPTPIAGRRTLSWESFDQKRSEAPRNPTAHNAPGKADLAGLKADASEEGPVPASPPKFPLAWGPRRRSLAA